jgi:hypothetical protein
MSARGLCRAAALGLAVGFASLAMPAVAHAQAQAPAPPQAARAAAPRPWTMIFGGGFMLDRSTADTHSINLMGSLVRVKPGSPWAQQVDGTVAYTRVEAGGFKQTVADSTDLKYLLRRQLAKRTALLIRPAYKRNTVQKVDYRVEELVGLEFVAATGRVGSLTFIPVGGAVQEEKNIPGFEKKTATVGGIQTATLTLRSANPEDSSAITEQLLYLPDLRNTEDYRVNFVVTLSNPIAGPFFVDVSYNFDREQVVQPGVDPTDQKVQVNFRMQLKF